MFFYLLVVVTLSGDGHRTVSFEKFESSYECSQALVAVSKEVKETTGTCTEIKRGE